MSIFLWMIIGIVTASLARKLMPGPAAGGISIAILIGVVGAIVGGLVGTIFSGNTWGPFNVFTVITAVDGALYPLFLYRCIAMRSRSPFRPRRESTNLSSLAPISAVRLSGRASVVPSTAVPVGAND